MIDSQYAQTADRVLLVDNSPTVLRVAKRVLRGAGYDVHALVEGHAVVEAALQFQPHLILLDFAMPHTNGYDVCRQLGESVALQDIPIVLMNTRGDPIGDRFVQEMGILDHITKPFAPEALLAVVAHTLDKSRNTDPGLLRRPLLWKESEQSQPGSAATRLAKSIVASIAETGGHGPALEPIRAVLEAPEQRRDLHDLLFERHDSPAITGDLSIVPIAEVLQLLQLQRQSGFLSVRHDKTLISIAFLKGEVRLVTGENLPTEFLLGNILVQENLIERRELEVLLRNRKGTTRRLGTQVVKLNYLTSEQLHAALRRQSSELVYAMLRWNSGRFAFEQRAELPDDVLEFEFGLGIDELLMEGFRRVDEWGLIEQTIVHLDAAPVRNPVADARIEALTQDETDMLNLVDGEFTLRELIEEHGRGTFAGARLLYRLISSKVLSMPVQPPPLPHWEVS